MKKLFAWMVATHLAVFTMGFALGIYLLPVLVAPPAPEAGQVRAAAQDARFRGTFRRDLEGSDALHWGEGEVTLSPTAVALNGRLAPGPAYRLYLVQGFVETNEAFRQARPRALPLGDIRTFDNFIVPVPAGTPLENYDTVVVWCEAFSQFITAAKYR
ncbi:MAG: DM13 domain-containing protein [Ramlibacter sp.]